VDSKYLQKNIDASLLAQVRLKYEETCVAEGYIQAKSVRIVEHSLGRTNLIRGGLDYSVKFQADICMPHPGQVFRIPVTQKSKIGIHAEMTPIKALLPRDLHIGNTDFEAVKEGEDIEFEVIGARFQQGDDSIVVLGKLRTIVRPATETPTDSDVQATEPVIAASTGPEGESAVKKVTVDISSTTSSEQGARRRRVRLNPAASTNEALA
jgi:DNA-directed RNA polymerase subunit E'/Rpb7